MKSQLQDWLDNLCSMLPRVVRAAYFPNLSDEASATFPMRNQDATDLVGAANLARQQAAPVTSGSSDENGNLLIAYPVTTEHHQGIVVVTLTASERRKEAVVQLLGWSVSWLKMLDGSRYSDHGASTALPGFENLPEFDLFEPDATFLALTTGLAEAWQVDKLSLALLNNDQLKLVARSHQTKVDTRVDLIRKIETTLDETLQQLTTEAFPADASTDAPMAAPEAAPTNHFALDALQETLIDEHLHIVPLTQGNKAVGALLLQRKSAPFTETETAAFKAVARFLAPLLDVYLQAQPGRLQRLKRDLYGYAGNLLGQGHVGFKMAFVTTVTLLVLLTYFPGDFEVTADATIEGLEQTIVVVPFDGYLESANARAGDRVSEGQVLATMNDRDLQLELNEVTAERDSLSREYRQALADLDQGQARILRARLDQAEARQALVQHRLSQILLTSPIAGVIISGDLSRSLGAPISRGTVLFEVAPLTGYRVALSIREADIDEVRAGLTGELILNSHPGTRIPLVIDRISAALEAKEVERIVFRAEGSLQTEQAFFRPGMEGTARIAIGERPLGWILFHDIIDWFRLMAWRYLP